MGVKFGDIENAFLYVSSSAPFMNGAILCRETGKTYYHSEMGDADEFPDGWEDDDKYIEIPHKNDLDLGKKLVFRFAGNELPDSYDDVRDMFYGSGAYRRFKGFLERRGMLEKWYAFENEQTKLALLEWCKDNGVECTE